MRNLTFWGAVAAALLAAAPAWAINKCVDAKGKVFYQSDPCPGTVKPQAPAAAGKKAAPAAQAAPAAKSAAPKTIVVRNPDGSTTVTGVPARKDAPKPQPRPEASRPGSPRCKQLEGQIEEMQRDLGRVPAEFRGDMARRLARTEREHKEVGCVQQAAAKRK